MCADRSDVVVLVTAAGQGDEDAWNEIVERYTPLVVTVAKGFRLPPPEVQDLAQTVWLHLVEHLRELREPRALPRWLVTTTKREALRQSRAARRTQPADFTEQGWAHFSAQLATSDDSDGALVRAEQRSALERCLAELTPRQQQLLALLSLDPAPSYAEISRRTGIPVGAIGPTRSRALARLRRSVPVRHLMTA